MAEYIEKDALIKQAEKSCLYFGVLSVIREVPTADVAPVVHGRWIDKGSLSCRCSNCGCKSPKEYDFCPRCGAKMSE